MHQGEQFILRNFDFEYSVRVNFRKIDIFIKLLINIHSNNKHVWYNNEELISKRRHYKLEKKNGFCQLQEVQYQ